MLISIPIWDTEENQHSFDDCLACIRAKVAGFKIVFLPCIDIDHVDYGLKTEYASQKKY